MRVVILLLLLAITTCQANLTITIHASGSGIVEINGPLDYSRHEVGFCQNLSECFNLNETDFRKWNISR
jgi:hypothetical protein